MTMPHERTRAVLWTYELLNDLVNPEKTPGVPDEIRRQARYCLRHFPLPHELHWYAQADPQTWGKPGEEP
jgi:hypothetical protein